MILNALVQNSKRVAGLFLMVLLFDYSGLSGQTGKIEFYSEKVEIEVLRGSEEGYRLRVSGDYRFRNRALIPRTQVIFFPFPISEVAYYPEEIAVIDRNDKNSEASKDFRRLNQGIAFSISIGPTSTRTVRVRYLQRLADARATYITTTAKAWGKPLELAEFAVTLPEKCRLKEMNYPPDRMEWVGGKTVYHVKIVDFTPVEDLTFYWEDSSHEIDTR